MRAMVIETGERADGRTPEEIPPASHPPRLPAARARLGPVPARADAGALRSDARHAQRVAAPGHHRPGRGQALHAPVQLPAVLHRRDGPHGRAEAPRDRPRGACRARASASHPRRGRVPLRHPRGERGAGVQRLVVHGLHLRLNACPHGCRRAHQGARVRHRHGPHQGGRRRGSSSPTSRASRTSWATWTSRCAARRRASRPCRWTTRPRAFRWTSWPRALKQAHDGRAFILNAMLEEIAQPARAAPRHRPAHRDHPHPRGQDPRRHRLRRQGGPRIQDETGASIDIQEDGTIHIAAVKARPARAAKAMILGIVKEPEVGEEYEGEVVGIQGLRRVRGSSPPGKDGLLHISRVANGRVGKVEDVLSLGDVVKVKVLEVDPNTARSRWTAWTSRTPPKGPRPRAASVPTARARPSATTVPDGPDAPRAAGRRAGATRASEGRKPPRRAACAALRFAGRVGPGRTPRRRMSAGSAFPLAGDGGRAGRGRIARLRKPAFPPLPPLGCGGDAAGATPGRHRESA